MYINIYTCTYVVMSRLTLALVHVLRSSVKRSVSGSIADMLNSVCSSRLAFRILLRV
jgi:hypothetical protein